MGLELLGLLAIGGLVTGLVVAWVGAPLFRGALPVTAPDPLVVALLARREAALALIRDLDADHAAGLLGDEEHGRLRAEAVDDGAAALAALDRLADERDVSSAALVAAVEAEVASRLEEDSGNVAG